MITPTVRCGCVLLILLLFASDQSSAQIIDHVDVDGVASLPQSTMDAIGGQRWFFSHASVGDNMMSGMADLHASNTGRYRLDQASVGFDEGQNRADAPPTPTTAGTIYECDRGNPGWEAKITIFQNSVNTSGWRSNATAIVMNKFCFIDQDANATQYADAMAALEAAWPATTFVYTTMPLTTDEDADNVLRNQYNTAVRQYCQSHARLLFDIADMESHDPAGNAATFASDGQTYQKLNSGYSSDGGHLSAEGCQRIALGWYAVAAAIAAGNGGEGETPLGPSAQPCGVCGPSAGTMMPVMLLGWGWMKRRRRRNRSSRR
ncbi:MAG: MYXO-CTERM sorting domain-containing protein [Planctomycetota bacterium]